MNEKEIIELIKNNPNCIKIISGGIGLDDDVKDFWDYVYTLITMKEILIGHELKPPFIVISDEQTKIECSNGNHIKPIAKEVVSIPSYEILPNIYVLSGKIYVSEYEYIISRNWVKEWIVREIEKGFHYLKLMKDNKFINTNKYFNLEL